MEVLFPDISRVFLEYFHTTENISTVELDKTMEIGFSNLFLQYFRTNASSPIFPVSGPRFDVPQYKTNLDKARCDSSHSPWLNQSESSPVHRAWAKGWYSFCVDISRHYHMTRSTWYKPTTGCSYHPL